MTHPLLTELGLAGKLTMEQDQVLSVTIENLQNKVDMQLGQIHRMSAESTMFCLTSNNDLKRLLNHIEKLEALLNQAGVTYPPAPLLEFQINESRNKKS